MKINFTLFVTLLEMTYLTAREAKENKKDYVDKSIAAGSHVLSVCFVCVWRCFEAVAAMDVCWTGEGGGREITGNGRNFRPYFENSL